MLVALTLLFAVAPATQAAGGHTTVDSAGAAQRSESSWIRVTTTAQGQLLVKLREKLVSDHGQTAGSYDYSVVKKLSVSGTLNSQDYTDLRNAAYAGGSIQELDLSGVVDSTTYVLSGMTALTDVSLPPVGSYTLANPFLGDVSLRNVVVAAETYVFGSTTTFNGITSLQRITFLHSTKPFMNASTFAGSGNADPANRTVTAVVPDKARGDYDTTAFEQYFASVAEAASADDVAELQNVIDDATAIGHGSAAAEYRWTLLQQAITAATSVHDDAAPTAAAVYRARLVLQTAISRVGVADLGLSLKVTHGAEVTLSWKNGTAQHYAEFTPHPVAKVDALSDGDYDVYVPTTTVPYVAQNIASAVIHGQTDKVAKVFTTSAATAGAQYTLTLAPLAQRADTALSIPGLGAGDNRGLYTNVGDTGVVNLGVGERFDLDTFRTQQAQLDQVNNLFIEPDYTFDVAGDSVTTRDVGRDGRRQLRITGVRSGVSVIKITYGPLHYLTATDNGTPGSTNWSFNGIDPQNTGVAVVQVGDVGTFDSGINVKNELDTYYFDKTVGARDFTFTPAPGTTVRVHDPLNVSAWGSGWHTYDAAPDGSYTVKLKGGRNIVELTNDGKVEYRVVRAKGVDVTVTNTTNPGQPFVVGDNARIAITGIEGGVEKLAGIYNPAFNAGTKGKLTYYDGLNQVVSNEAPQYQTAITTFNVNYAYTGVGAGDKALNGDMFIGGLGAEWPYHRQIPQEGKPANLAAVAIGPYHFGGLPTLYVRGDQVSTSPGAPGAPTNLQASRGNGSAELSWTAPTSTGGLPVIGYRVRISSDGGAHWQTKTVGTSTTQTLTDLTNGTEYAVQVAAFNSANTGAYTASQAVTPRTVPGVPANLTLTPRHRSLDLSWTAPGSGGSPITGYRVRYSSDAGQSWTTQDHGTATEQTLTGLNVSTSYAVQVAAINAEGSGVFTASATATPTKTGAALGTPAVEDRTTTSAKIVTNVDPGDLDQSVTVERSTNADHADPVVSAAAAVPAGAGDTPVTISLTALTSNTTYHYRVVVKASDGDVVRSGWLTFESSKVVAGLGAVSVSEIGTKSASVAAVVTPGDLAQDVTVEYSMHADHSGAATSPAATVPAGAGASTVTTPLPGLTPGTEVFYRVVLTATDGERISGSWASFATAVPDAPTVSLTADATDLRVGDTVRLTWTAGGAETLTASGDWSGTKAVGGTQDVVVDRAGDLTFSVTAIGGGGTTTATVNVRVAHAPAQLTVKAPTGLVHVGRSATVAVTGLVAGEAYRITIAGITVGTGVAPASGPLSRTVVVPTALPEGTVSVRVLGSVDDRSGAASLQVVAARKLTVKVTKAKVGKGGKQRVSVSGLAARERVRLVYRGEQIAVVTASSKGTVTRAFAVGKVKGTRTVKAYGVTDDRTGAKAFKVVR